MDTAWTPTAKFLRTVAHLSQAEQSAAIARRRTEVAEQRHATAVLQSDRLRRAAEKEQGWRY